MANPTSNYTPTTPNPLPSTQSIQAARKFIFGSLESERADGFDHLVGICFKACHKLFVPSEWSRTIETGGNHFVDGKWVPLQPTKHETRHQLLRQFCQETVLTILAPFHGCTTDEFNVAICDPNSNIRHIGRHVCQALLSRIRNCEFCGLRKVRYCVECDQNQPARSPVSGACANCSKPLEEKKYRCGNGCGMPSLRVSLDKNHSGTGDDKHDEIASGDLGEFVIGPPMRATRTVWKQSINARGETIVRPVSDDSPEMTAKAFLARHKAFFELNDILEGAIVADIARSRQLEPGELLEFWGAYKSISPRSAERKRTKFQAKLNELRNHPIVEEFLEIMAPEPKFHTIGDSRVTCAESSYSKAARIARQDAGKLNQQFRKEENQPEVDPLIIEMAEQAASMDEDEVRLLRKNATLYQTTEASFMAVRQEELATAYLEDVSEEDLEYLAEIGHDFQLDTPRAEFEDELHNWDSEYTCPEDEQLDVCP